MTRAAARSIAPLALLCVIGCGIVVASFIGPGLHRRFGGNAWLVLVFAWAALSFLGAKLATQAGTVRALGVTSAQRSPALPDVPAVAEVVPGYEASAWFGAAAPKGTPPAVIARLNREINAGLADPAMRAKLADLGGVPIGGTPEQFWALHRMETEKWAKIVQFSGAKPE